MNLKVLINPKAAEGHPFEMFFVGFVYAFISVLIAMWLFNEYASIVMISVTMMASLPIVYQIVKLEAKKDITLHKEYRLLKEHEKALNVFTFLFLGFVAGFTVWFFFLSPGDVQSIFGAQIDTILEINTPTGNFIKTDLIGRIFLNNLRILFLCVILSLMFGAGAILILSWNASVMATAIGSFIRDKIIVGTGGYFSIISSGLLRYLIHGVPEITAYFTGGLAGGIVYIAFLKKKINRHILFDVLVMISISVIILFLAAVLEVHFTPLIVK